MTLYKKASLILKKYIYISLGTLTFVLGFIGIYVPLLPTTPFWLLTCWFYVRGSERLYNRFMSNRLVGKYLHNYLVEKAIPLKSKIYILTVMWAGMALSAWLIGKLWVALLLFAIGVGVTIHIASFRTKRD